MFDQVERRFFATRDVQQLLPPIQDALYRGYGVMLVQTGPAQWVGRGTTPSYSMYPKVVVKADPLGDGISLEVRVLADLDSAGIAMVVSSTCCACPSRSCSACSRTKTSARAARPCCRRSGTR